MYASVTLNKNNTQQDRNFSIITALIKIFCTKLAIYCIMTTGTNITVITEITALVTHKSTQHAYSCSTNKCVMMHRSLGLCHTLSNMQMTSCRQIVVLLHQQKPLYAGQKDN